MLFRSVSQSRYKGLQSSQQMSPVDVQNIINETDTTIFDPELLNYVMMPLRESNGSWFTNEESIETKSIIC